MSPEFQSLLQQDELQFPESSTKLREDFIMPYYRILSISFLTWATFVLLASCQDTTPTLDMSPQSTGQTIDDSTYNLLSNKHHLLVLHCDTISNSPTLGLYHLPSYEDKMDSISVDIGDQVLITRSDTFWTATLVFTSSNDADLSNGPFARDTTEYDLAHFPFRQNGQVRWLKVRNGIGGNRYTLSFKNPKNCQFTSPSATDIRSLPGMIVR